MTEKRRQKTHVNFSITPNMFTSLQTMRKEWECQSFQKFRFPVIWRILIYIIIYFIITRLYIFIFYSEMRSTWLSKVWHTKNSHPQVLKFYTYYVIEECHIWRFTNIWQLANKQQALKQLSIFQILKLAARQMFTH